LIDAILVVTLHRKVMNPAGFTFSDGVTVPYGCYLSAPSYIVHRLAENFENPDVFDGLRFYKLRTGGEEQVGEDDVVKHQLTTPATSNLVFGIGKHVCPGRLVS
jgi:cytochrome P450